MLSPCRGLLLSSPPSFHYRLFLSAGASKLNLKGSPHLPVGFQESTSLQGGRGELAPESPELLVFRLGLRRDSFGLGGFSHYSMIRGNVHTAASSGRCPCPCCHRLLGVSLQGQMCRSSSRVWGAENGTSRLRTHGCVALREPFAISESYATPASRKKHLP